MFELPPIQTKKHAPRPPTHCSVPHDDGGFREIGFQLQKVIQVYRSDPGGPLPSEREPSFVQVFCHSL